MRNNKVNNNVVLMDKRLAALSENENENYNARIDVYAIVLRLTAEIETYGKQRLNKELSKQSIEIDKIIDIKELLWLVDNFINDFELLVEFDYKQHNSAVVPMRVYEDLVKYLNNYKRRLEDITFRLIVLDYKGKIRESLKALDNIQELIERMSKLLY